MLTMLRPRKARRALCVSPAALLPATLAALMALSGALALCASAKTVSLTCRGSSSACRAVVLLAGGASREKLQIALSDTDLKLASVLAKPRVARGAYQLSKASYSLGGSLYTVTLNALSAIPKGATLTFSFAVPATPMSCESVIEGVSRLTITKLAGKQSKGAYECQQANALADTWTLRSDDHQSLASFAVSNITYSCKRLSAGAQNVQCEGGGTRVRFRAG